jgi:uncharacterized membrane protein YjjP (DUF1212 family)
VDELRKYIQKHKTITWIVVLGYVIFSGFFGFPFSNELFPFEYSKGVTIVAGYGIIGSCFAGLLVRGKVIVVLLATLIFTIIGMILRYYLEFGEVSNSMNFIPINIILYLVIVPIYCTLVYWLIYKFSKYR